MQTTPPPCCRFAFSACAKTSLFKPRLLTPKFGALRRRARLIMQTTPLLPLISSFAQARKAHYANPAPRTHPSLKPRPLPVQALRRLRRFYLGEGREKRTGKEEKNGEKGKKREREAPGEPRGGREGREQGGLRPRRRSRRCRRCKGRNPPRGVPEGGGETGNPRVKNRQLKG